MTGKLNDKVAIITGAGSGIGKQACLLFAKEGAKIVCADINEKAAQETVAAIETLCGGSGLAVAFKCDVSKEDQVKAMVALAESTFGNGAFNYKWNVD